VVTRNALQLAAICSLFCLGCQDETVAPPADYASFYQMSSRQWVTKVEGIKPNAVPRIREIVEQVPGVRQGSVLIHSDYVAYQSTAEPGDRMEHSRVGIEVTAILKKEQGLRVSNSTTGPQ